VLFVCTCYCLQVSGIRFAFDPSKEPGSRVLHKSVTVGSERAPLDPAKTYTLATKAYLAEGKDGYDVLQVGLGPGLWSVHLLKRAFCFCEMASRAFKPSTCSRSLHC
jgi:hypothetical protein